MGKQSLGELLPLVVFGILCFANGASWLAIKVGLQSLPPLSLAGIRFTIAWGVLVAYALATRTRFPRTKRAGE